MEEAVEEALVEEEAVAIKSRILDGQLKRRLNGERQHASQLLTVLLCEA
jgi:hypothetical protein